MLIFYLTFPSENESKNLFNALCNQESYSDVIKMKTMVSSPEKLFCFMRFFYIKKYFLIINNNFANSKRFTNISSSKT